MAWWAELKRRNWYCICQFDAITYYSAKLYEEWYNSLTDEQKDLLEKRREERRRRDREDAERALRHLMYLPAMLHDVYRL